MVLLLRPAGGALDAAPQVPGEHQVGDRCEEMGGGTGMGWRPDFQDEVEDAGHLPAG